MTKYKNDNLAELMTPKRAFIVFQHASNFCHLLDQQTIKFNPTQKRVLTHGPDNPQQKLPVGQDTNAESVKGASINLDVERA